MDKFKRNEIDFGANASAVLADKGAAASAQFVDGVAVFVRPIRGAMAEASLGGQQITYLPKWKLLIYYGLFKPHLAAKLAGFKFIILSGYIAQRKSDTLEQTGIKDRIKRSAFDFVLEKVFRRSFRERYEEKPSAKIFGNAN